MGMLKPIRADEDELNRGQSQGKRGLSLLVSSSYVLCSCGWSMWRIGQTSVPYNVNCYRRARCAVCYQERSSMRNKKWMCSSDECLLCSNLNSRKCTELRLYWKCSFVLQWIAISSTLAQVDWVQRIFTQCEKTLAIGYYDLLTTLWSVTQAPNFSTQ